jgi:hypothetical protein
MGQHRLMAKEVLERTDGGTRFRNLVLAVVETGEVRKGFVLFDHPSDQALHRRRAIGTHSCEFV